MFHLDKIIFYDGFISFAPTSPNGGGWVEEKSCKPPIMMDTENCFEIQIYCKNRLSPTMQMKKCCCNNFKLANAWYYWREQSSGSCIIPCTRLGGWRNSLTAISYSSRTKLHIWLEHGFNLALFRTSSRNKARTKPCGLSVCGSATELHRLSCQIYLISSFHKDCDVTCY